MSKPTGRNEVWVSVGLTLNLGNYESARLDAGMSVPIEEGETENQAFKRGWDKVLAEIEGQAIEVKGKLGK